MHTSMNYRTQSWGARKITRGMRALETLVSSCGGNSQSFCAGTGSPTLADIVMVPQLSNARRCVL